MDSTAQRRLEAIQGHLLPATDNSRLQIQTNHTAGEFSLDRQLCSATRDDEEIADRVEKVAKFSREVVPSYKQFITPDHLSRYVYRPTDMSGLNKKLLMKVRSEVGGPSQAAKKIRLAGPPTETPPIEARPSKSPTSTPAPKALRPIESMEMAPLPAEVQAQAEPVPVQAEAPPQPELTLLSSPDLCLERMKLVVHEADVKELDDKSTVSVIKSLTHTLAKSALYTTALSKKALAAKAQADRVMGEFRKVKGVLVKVEGKFREQEADLKVLREKIKAQDGTLVAERAAAEEARTAAAREMAELKKMLEEERTARAEAERELKVAQAGLADITKSVPFMEATYKLFWQGFEAFRSEVEKVFPGPDYASVCLNLDETASQFAAAEQIAEDAQEVQSQPTPQQQ